MSRKGQITMFIILGVIILVGVILFLAFRSERSEDLSKEEEISSDILPIKTFVQQCLESVLSKGVYTLGYQGGHVFLQDRNLGLEIRDKVYNVSYVYYEGEPTLVTFDQMEQELSNYLKIYLVSCTKGFEDFQDYEVSGKISDVQAEFDDNKTLFKIKYPLEIRKGDSISELSDFQVVFDVRLKHLHEIAETIVNNSVTMSPCLVDIDYFKTLNFNMTTVAYKNNTIVYMMRDPKSKLVEESYAFIFASKIGQECKVSMDQVNLRIMNGVHYADFSELDYPLPE